MIDPKVQFLSSLTPESNFRNFILSRDFQNALTLSFAQLALVTRSPEQLDGAKKFVEILSTIGDPISKPMGFPDKPLDHSQFNPAFDQKKKSKKKE